MIDVGTLYERYRRLVAYHIRSRLRTDDYSDTEDLVQDVFCRAIKCDGVFDRSSDGEIKSWLARTASNLVIDYYRRRRVLERPGTVMTIDESCTQIPAPEQLETDDRLDPYLAPLKARERELLRLRYGSASELSMLEAADAMGLSHQTARHIHSRAIQKIRRALAA